MFINTAFFVTTKITLENHQIETTELIVKNVRTSIDSTTNGEAFFNLVMAKNLRKASVLIKNSLPSKIDQVRNEDLVKLTKSLELGGISLFAKKGNDIVIAKSSKIDEIGVSTNNWGKSNLMIHELFEDKKAHKMEGVGEGLDHFWSSPIDNSTATPKLRTKWGYYFDGTTDFIINPFIQEKVIQAYNQNAGVDSTIEQIMQSNPTLMEISVLNSHVMKEDKILHDNADFVWYSERLIVYGKYNYKTKKDETNIEKAIKSNKVVNEVLVIGGKEVLKSYVPITYKSETNSKNGLVIIVSSDNHALESSLSRATNRILLISLICIVIGYFFIFHIMRVINKKEKTIFNIQDMYSEHTENLFRTVKEHRHDFNHHLSTISGLERIGLHRELREYVDNLITVQIEISDIIDVNIPAFSGLLQAKVAEAVEKQIKFEHYFEKFELMNLDMLKITDLVRVIGNLIDNAFHEVVEKLVDNRRVIITGKYQTGIMFVNIFDNGDAIPEKNLTEIFNSGFTTRKDKGGNGLGLVSSKKIIDKYKGTITVKSDENWTKFSIQVPVMPREIISKNKKNALKL